MLFRSNRIHCQTAPREKYCCLFFLFVPIYCPRHFQVFDLEMDAKTIEVLNSRSSSADRYSLFILIQVLFMDAKGDMRREVPAVNS